MMVWFLKILGNPLNEKQALLIGQLFFIPIKSSGLNYLLSWTEGKNRSNDSGNSYRRTQIFLSV